jgi:putative transcriptional regulator|nr:MAG TPA: Repressor protein CI [Caudoviricetes sp.]
MNKLKKLRTDRDLKQIELAKEIGVTKQTMSCYELGVIKPSLDKAKKIADFFGCSIEDIFFNN